MFFETLHLISSQCVDVSIQKKFWSVSKYGRKATIFKLVNCLSHNTVTISLSHPSETTSRIFFFKTYLRCSTSGLVVSARKWFWCVNKYGRRQPSLINLFNAFSSDLLVPYCQEFNNTILLMNNNYSNHETNMVIQGS